MPDIAEPTWSESDQLNEENVPYGWPAGMPSYADQVGRMMMGAIKRSYNRSNPVYEGRTSGDNYVIVAESPTSVFNLYEIVRFRAGHSNATDAPTLKFSEVPAYPIVKVGNSGLEPISAGDILEGADSVVWLEPIGPSWVLSNPRAVGSGGGSVSTVSVATANGFSGTVANPTTTPAITIRTSVNGLLQGNGTAVSAATTSGFGAVVLATGATLTNATLVNATGLPPGATGPTGPAGRYSE
jgi:hypothetical protein